MFKFLLPALLVVFCLPSYCQFTTTLNSEQWVDSVFKSLTKDQKIAQLMIVRLSSIDPATRQITFYNKEVEDAIRRFNVGGVCLFQGGPVTQVSYVNYFQSITKTPLLVSMDAENGVGMRMDSVRPLPRQMMLGALSNPDLVYQFGHLVATQCKRIGVQVDYAPVADINNNPDNPVINDRSFGEDKYKVATFAVQYMKGLQEWGVMASAKHFPGHGDVSVDSHVDLPVINKSMEQLDSVELYPFKELIKNGVGSVMVGHLFVPAIDDQANLPSSLSYKSVTRLLKKRLKFTGLSFTDALEMKGVTKNFPGTEASVQSLVAGNDMLCLPADIEGSIAQVELDIKKRKLKWKDLDARVKKVLAAKYAYGLATWQKIDTAHLADDLNSEVNDMYKRVAENAITLLRQRDSTSYPLSTEGKKKIAYLGIGLAADNEFATRMRTEYHAHIYYFDYTLDSNKAAAAAELIKERYDLVIIGVHNYNRFPADNFGISKPAVWLAQRLQQQGKSITLVFGNPYAIKNFCDAPDLVACYDDNEITQDVCADWLAGKFPARGKLPVSVCDRLPFGSGITNPAGPLPEASPASLGFIPERLLVIDSICQAAIAKQATPGCVVLVAKDGKIAYEKAFGYLSYERSERVYRETIYDLASVTKICATTMAVMKLYEEGKLDLHKTLGDYLPWLQGSNKASLKIWDVLLHQAGLKDFIPFYQETITTTKEGYPLATIYSAKPDSIHSIRVAENLYMRKDWRDTMFLKILQSNLGPTGKYVYSDNDFIFMGKVVEAITGKTLDQYVKETYYDPLRMGTTGFRPRERFSIDRIAPTEAEPIFRRQVIRGDVHDPGAAMFGGVSGHAGLFSDAYDLAILEQMLLNGGQMEGQTFLKQQTIDYFTSYHSDTSRRGLGFDKPEKDNLTRKEPYPCLSASPQTFGHTGFTGICVWVDPKYNLIFIFLSNRVNPFGNNTKLSSLSVRGSIMEAIYHALDLDRETILNKINSW